MERLRREDIGEVDRLNTYTTPVRLLYANTKSAFKASIVMLAVPFSAIGAFWLLWILGYNLSIAVCFIGGLALRLAAIRWHWRLPVFSYQQRWE